ncbi:glutathione S-transferase [Acidisphaera sp. L21]|jgi:glutathione S-transferase|uniref:glutathione S-transferase n=1 Tax=Acidisphaera sp. L21 TaxID=1641851 RepID=UPI00131D3A26|nr:glutathione S-transferase [Acidisphaera sp. L21]
MADGTLVIGTKRYSSWSLRGWLAVRLAGLDVVEHLIPLAGGSTAAIKGATPAGMVPYLEHNGARVWESLSICEYCAEIEPALWPADRIARAAARSIAGEMHAGFRAVRQAMPMNLGRIRSLPATEEVLVDIARIETIWRDARHGTRFLYSDTFGAADAMYAPVVARFLSYLPDLTAESRGYCQAVREHPLVVQWYDAAAAEPAEWMLARYEDVP